MKALKVLAFSLLAASAVNAADLPRRGVMPAAVMSPAPMASWTGFYAGAHVGYNSTYGFNPNFAGVLGGLQAGYDHQFGQFVAGLAADISLANLRASQGTISVQENYTGSLRARLGVAVSPQFLLYGTGGYVYANFKATDTSIPTTVTKTVGGATLGLGGEFKFDRNWAAFAEYRHNWLKDSGSTLNQNDFRVGVNYRF